MLWDLIFGSAIAAVTRYAVKKAFAHEFAWLAHVRIYRINLASTQPGSGFCDYGLLIYEPQNHLQNQLT